MIDELNAHFAAVKAPLLMKGFASLWRATFTEDLPLNDLLFVYLRDRGVHFDLLERADGAAIVRLEKHR